MLPHDLIKKLSVTMKSETFLQNDVIFKPGDENISMHVITNGTVAMFNATGVELRHFEDDDFFGEFFLFEGTPIDKYIIAVEITETYSITKDNFIRIMNETDPVFFNRAKLIACNTLYLDQIFDHLIELVIPMSSRSTASTTPFDASYLSHNSVYLFNP